HVTPAAPVQAVVVSTRGTAPHSTNSNVYRAGSLAWPTTSRRRASVGLPVNQPHLALASWLPAKSPAIYRWVVYYCFPLCAELRPHSPAGLAARSVAPLSVLAV